MRSHLVRKHEPTLSRQLGLCTGVAAAQAAPATENPYAHSNEFFVGGSYLRAEPGPNLSDTNFGGWNVAATHFSTPRMGFTVDVQGDYGHASIPGLPSADPSVYKYLFLAGPQIRLHKTDRFSSSIRLLAGAADSNANIGKLGVPPSVFGFYPNATKLAFKPGGAFDYNLSPRVALRIFSGILLEREDGDFQRRINVSTGLVFRLGK